MLNQPKTLKDLYREELKLLMNTPEIYGIREETLFRMYEEKIKCGKGIVETML
jgi:hypothetical protein